MQSTDKRKVKEQILVTLTETERAQKGQELAAKMAIREKVQSERQLAVSGFSGKLKVLDEEVSKLVRIVDTGKELRFMDLEEEYFWKAGVVRRYLLEPERKLHDERLIQEVERQIHMNEVATKAKEKSQKTDPEDKPTDDDIQF